ncbi:MAG: aldo/keto reductase [Armatimonadota bacterium]
MKISIVGFGGIVAMNMPQADTDKAVAKAIDKGVNYFDFAPSYGDDEERLGPALKGRRDDVFLACKTGQRMKEGASQELHRSLQRLQTDHFDVYQLHGVPDINALDQIFGNGGAMETLIDAKEKGLTRFLGITCHHPEVAIEAFNRYNFDTVLFPVNFIYWYKDGAGPQVIDAASAKGIGRVAMKGMALKRWDENADRKWGKCWYQPNDDPTFAELAFRFTLSQNVSTFLPPGHLELFEMAVGFADRFKPLQPDEEEFLKHISSTPQSIFSE